MSDLESQSPDGYQLVAVTVERSISEFVKPFKLTANAIASDPKSFNEYNFFDTILKSVSVFTDSLCETLAKGLRTITHLPEVRGTPTSTLAPRIRQDVFTKLDAILLQYIQIVQVLGIRYSETSTTGAALTGAVVGKVLGSGSASSDVYAIIGGFLGAAQASRQKQNLQSQARLAAYSAIRSYIDELHKLPDRLLDFGVALTYGGSVDFQEQARSLHEIEGKIHTRIQTCSELIPLFLNVRSDVSFQQTKGDRLLGFLIAGILAFLGLAFSAIALFAQTVQPVPVVLITLIFLALALMTYLHTYSRAHSGTAPQISTKEKILVLSRKL